MAPTFLAFFSKRQNANSSSRPSPTSRPKSPADILPSPSLKSIPSPSIADASENMETSELSLENGYVLADVDRSPLNSNSVYPSSSDWARTSTPKLKIPFRKKQPASTHFNAALSQRSASQASTADVPHKLSVESSVSESPSLLPPPSRSAIFGSYADPHSALSTRSLPQGVPPHLGLSNVSQRYETMSNPDSHTPPPATPQPKQSSKSGLFSWARHRARTKSKVSPPDLPLPSAPVLTLPPTESFNLKSFRHITSLSTENPSSSPPKQDPSPLTRPRESSFASDSSQRISVAAFREARRNATDSPVPTLPGDRDSFASSQVTNRRRSSTFSTPASVHTVASQSRVSVRHNTPTRTTTMALSSAARETSSESSEEEESESEEEATLRPSRKRTITNRSVQSELGHRSSPVLSSNATRSDVGHALTSVSPNRLPLSTRNARNPPNPAHSRVGSRSSSVHSPIRSSLSTPALVPETAAKNVSGILKRPAAPRPTKPLPRSRSRASTSSDSSSDSSSSDDAPLASLMPPQRPGSSMSRASASPSRRPAKPLIDIGQLVGENSTLPPRTTEPPNDPPHPASQTDSPAARSRKPSLGFGERLSALASGFGGLQPSRSKSPELARDPKDEAFTPPDVPERPPRSQSPVLSPRSSPISPTKPSLPLPAPKPKASKSLAMRLKSSSSGTPKLDTLSLKHESVVQPPPSSSSSSEALIPPITPTPIRERREPPAFAVTSRPTSHVDNQSSGKLAHANKAAAGTEPKPALRRPGQGVTDQQPRQDQPQRRRQQPEESQSTVRVVRSVPLKSAKEEPLPVPRPLSRTSVPSVTISNVHLTPPTSSTSTSLSALRQVTGSNAVVLPRRPFVLRDSSPASSAGDSSSSRMPATPRDGSELGVGHTGRPGHGHRKRASVAFVDEVDDKREGRERERELRKISVGTRPSHGHGPAAVDNSSDDEDTARDREREAEEKRKERRRGEAKAAIELGNVINGTGPIDDDDDEDEGVQPMNVPPRMSMTMGTGIHPGHNVPFPTGVGPMRLQGQWGASPASPFSNPLNDLSMQNLLNAGAGPGLAGGMNTAMGAGMVDPRALAVHQQAMMIAKQTYQLAIAQQAMRDAGEEWERGSSIGPWSGGRSNIGTPNMLGMGMNMNMNMNMGGVGSGMGGFPGPASAFPIHGAGMWLGGAMPGFPGNPAHSMYAGNIYAASEIGGGASDRASAAGWGTTSVFGESFGAPRDRTSRAFRQSQLQYQVAMASGSGSNGASAAAPATKRDGGRPRTRTAPSGASGGQRTSSAAVKKRGDGGHGLVGVVSPPSSWKGPL